MNKIELIKRKVGEEKQTTIDEEVIKLKKDFITEIMFPTCMENVVLV